MTKQLIFNVSKITKFGNGGGEKVTLRNVITPLPDPGATLTKRTTASIKILTPESFLEHGKYKVTFEKIDD